MQKKNCFKTLTYLEIIHDTGMAVLINFGKCVVWLPKSQVSIFPLKKIILIPFWLSYKHNLK